MQRLVTFTLKELAAMSGGELVGDSTLNIAGAASLGEATQGEISFFTNRKYIGLLRKTRASAILFLLISLNRLVQDRFAFPIRTKAFEQVVLKFATEANHLRARNSSQRDRRSKCAAGRACFDPTPGSNRSRAKNRRRHDHRCGQLCRTRNGDRVRVPHLSACDNSRAKPDWLARNHSQRRCDRS